MFAAVVLAGGAAYRLGGTSKPTRTVGGIALLTRVLAVLSDARPVIVVGPANLPLPDGVLRTLEDPPGGGPVAAIAAGVALLPDPADDRDLVAVLASDLPFLTAGALSALRTAADGHDAAFLIDAGGRAQWLCGVWRLAPLRRRLAEVSPAGLGVRQLAAGLGIDQVSYPAASAPPAWFDCDTEEDLQRAEELAHGEPGRMDR